MKPFTSILKQTRGILLILLTMLCCRTAAQGQPVANFTSDIINGCSPIVVNFSDQSSGNPTEWKWDLGNGTFSNLQNPSVTYFAAGHYTVKLIVKAGNNRDSVTRINYITVFPSATVNFFASAIEGCNPFTVHFTDQTIPVSSISTWQWDFGDGILSNLQHPSHTYTQAGDYSVTLKVINSNGCASTLRRPGYIKNHFITAGFVNFAAGACVPGKITFQNSSTGSGTISCRWDFGDGTVSQLENPVHIFSGGGNYTVKLVVRNQYGCVDTFSKNLVLQSPVSAAFTADNQLNCKAPAAVNFSNQVLPGNFYAWDFGDSTVSSLSNPSHIYADTGAYTVKLVVKNSNGCIDSVIKTGYIKIQKPAVSFDNLPDSGCVAFTKTFSATNTSNISISSYLWNFGDGSSTTQANPVHLFANTGYYNISLVTTGANGCKDTLYMPNAIHTSTRPVANFSAAIRNACASTGIQFTDLSTGGATAWNWSFGDNGFSPDQHPVHVYTDTGWMTVQLTAMNGGCGHTATFQDYIYLKPAVAKFTFDYQCSEPFKRNFHDLSIGADHLLWNFGDGDTSTMASPVHHFPGPGIYFVKLTAINDATGCEYSKTKRVKILDITSNFTASDSSICKDERINFSTTAVNPDIIKYFWNFGDDSVNVTRVNHISHGFHRTGTFPVQLITMDSLNCMDTVVQPLYISVHGPKANFSTLYNGGCLNAAMNFIDASVAETGNPVKSWVWNFGDGSRDTLAAAPFVHAYQNLGTYWVSLKLTDSLNCTDSFRLHSPIEILKPSAKFYISDSIACPGYAIKFTCPYYEPGSTYYWDFGDSTVAGAQILYHSYSRQGAYTVKLRIRNRYGCEDSSIAASVIWVKKTVAGFDMSDSFRTCPPLLIQFTSHAANALSEIWNFGDSSNTSNHNPSHFYTYPGVYTATLIAKGPGACADTMQRRIIVKGPKGTISYSPLRLCRPYQVHFSAHTEDAASYIWDFNDGVTAAGTDTVLRYTYQDSGSFLPKIILVDDIGCRVAVTGRDTVTNVYVKPFFQFPDSLLCNAGAVTFPNTSTCNDPITSFNWNFGDSTISHAPVPVHQFPHPGVYYPSLSVTTATGCTGEYHSPAPVRIAVSPDISMLTGGNGCAPLNTTFNAVLNSTDSGTISWLWDFGNDNTAALQDPPAQLFSDPGTYTVSLTAKSSSGCSKTIQKTIEAFATPVVKINGNRLLCRGLSLNLAADGGVKYKWYPAATLNCDTCATVIAKPASTTQYLVTGTSQQGCSNSDSVTVNVKQPFVMTYSRPANICPGQSSRLQANGASTYQWYPAQGLSSTTVADPTAKPDSTTNYRVIGADNDGCFADTGYVRLTVYKNPTVDAGADKTVSAGLPVDLEAVYSNDVTYVNWSPTGDIFRPGTNIITVKPILSTEYTVEVKNNGGCSASDRVKVIVKFDGSNVFIPNLFSPNNDGVNDVFYPRGRGVFKIKKMAIFSRWGELVFEKTNFNSNDASVGWDGTFKGSKLTTDVFVYVVELMGEDGTVLPLSGNVSLVR